MKDNSGAISLEEFKNVFGVENIKDDDWKQIIKEVDDNGDGEVFFFFFFLILFGLKLFICLKLVRFHISNSKILCDDF